MPKTGLKIGLLGGSFNPAHEGHRHLSLNALAMLGLDQVWWLVSPQNPLKPADGMASLVQRMAHARAVADHPRIRVSDVEARLGTRYTVDTLSALTSRLGNHRFVWLMGADNLAQLPRWAHWQRILAMVPVAVFDREPYSWSVLGQQAAQKYRRFRWAANDGRAMTSATPPAWGFFRMQRHPMSATRLRANGATPWSEDFAPQQES